MATYDNIPLPPEPKPVYSIEEVAALLGVHRSTVSGFISRGELVASRLGHRTVRIGYPALMAFLKSKEWTPSAGVQKKDRGQKG